MLGRLVAPCPPPCTLSTAVESRNLSTRTWRRWLQPAPCAARWRLARPRRPQTGVRVFSCDRSTSSGSSGGQKQDGGQRMEPDPSPLLPREWKHLSSGTDSGQFNALADSLSLVGGFCRAPPACLEWEARKQPLLEEILRHEPDVACLQEVDHFDDWFEPQLKLRGYAGVFKKKGGESKDGCCVFYKTDKFRMESVQSFHLRETDGQVAICVELEPLSGGKRILLTTTHLKATKTAEGEQFRLAQINYLLQRLEASSAQCLVPHVVLLTGDMNASAIGSKYDSLVYPAITEHSLGLVSAYSWYRDGSAASGAAGEPEFTSFKIRDCNSHTGGGVAKYTIDFIFCSKGAVRPLSLLQMPTSEEVGEDGLPSYRYPSDHLAIAAQLEIE